MGHQIIFQQMKSIRIQIETHRLLFLRIYIIKEAQWSFVQVYLTTMVQIPAYICIMYCWSLLKYFIWHCSTVLLFRIWRGGRHINSFALLLIAEGSYSYFSQVFYSVLSHILHLLLRNSWLQSLDVKLLSLSLTEFFFVVEGVVKFVVSLYKL